MESGNRACSLEPSSLAVSVWSSATAAVAEIRKADGRGGGRGKSKRDGSSSTCKAHASIPGRRAIQNAQCSGGKFPTSRDGRSQLTQRRSTGNWGKRELKSTNGTNTRKENSSNPVTASQQAKKTLPAIKVKSPPHNVTGCFAKRKDQLHRQRAAQSFDGACMREQVDTNLTRP